MTANADKTSTANAGYLFYKKFYHKFDDSDWSSIITAKSAKDICLLDRTNKSIEEINKEILDKFNNESIAEINKKILGIKPDASNPSPVKRLQGFRLITTNPGLLIGSGYSHETGIENEFKIGFFFDHTTGLPVIPGSSVKGVLRSVFPKPDEPHARQNGKKSYLKNLLKGILNKELSDEELIDLENAVFEGIYFDKDKKKKRIPMAKRDIFFDAGIIKTTEKDNKIFGKDSITPHKHPLKNPIPLKFLKVLPGVVFQFSFRLSDVGGIPADEKKRLFQDILLTIGAGAKTNVGYGQFVEYKDQSVNTIHTTA